MTARKAPATPPVDIVPPPGSPLEALLAEHDDAEAAFNAAKARFEEIKEGIKGELARYGVAGVEEIRVISPYLSIPRALKQRTQMRFDTTRFKAEQTLLYCQYAKESTSWNWEKVK